MEVGFSNLIEGTFNKRLNRFVAEIYINGVLEKAHVPNTGRMKELLIPGTKVLLKKSSDVNRKTKYDLLLVHYNDILVAIDSKLPNLLLHRAFKEKQLPYFDDYYEVKKEVTYKNSRFDLALTGKSCNVLIEAKCVTLVDNGIAKFPDAPTERGVKHIEELIEAQDKGFKSAIFFIIQRNDAREFSPNWNMDYNFSKALEMAYEKGILVKPLLCNVSKQKIYIEKEVELKV